MVKLLQRKVVFFFFQRCILSGKKWLKQKEEGSGEMSKGHFLFLEEELGDRIPLCSRRLLTGIDSRWEDCLNSGNRRMPLELFS